MSFDTNTHSQTLAPFIDGFIHDKLLQSTPQVDEMLLQFGDVTNSRLVGLYPLQHRREFSYEYGCERILKIGSHLPKL